MTRDRTPRSHLAYARSVSPRTRVVSLCGRHVHDDHTTTDPDAVTCRQCRRRRGFPETMENP